MFLLPSRVMVSFLLSGFDWPARTTEITWSGVEWWNKDGLDTAPPPSPGVTRRALCPAVGHGSLELDYVLCPSRQSARGRLRPTAPVRRSGRRPSWPDRRPSDAGGCGAKPTDRPLWLSAQLQLSAAQLSAAHPVVMTHADP